MKMIEKILEEHIKHAVSSAFPDADISAVFVQKTNNPEFGDFQTNFAMVAAKQLKMQPRMAAEKIVAALQSDAISRADIAGPGFINLFLNSSFVGSYVAAIGEENYEFDFLDRHGEVIIDYSSPNIAKRMHIGHLRSTVIGDSIKRIYNWLGYHTVADNHIGDWGTQYGKLIIAYRNWLDRAAYESSPVEELERIYVEFEKRSEENPQLIDDARREVKKLQDGDAENTRLWQEFIDVSMKEYGRMYDRLDITFDTHNGESFYHDMMPHIVDTLTSQGIAVEDQGALVVFFDEKENLHPCIIRKQDGAFLYATSDLACIEYRYKTYDVNRLVYVTDERQQPHFKQVFAVAKRLGWTITAEHVWFGMMRFVDGVFSTRKGNVICLDDLLSEAVKRARAIVEEKNPELSPEEKHEVAEAVGIGAVKYADLSQSRTSVVTFEWDKMLSFDGNTAPYLQYVYARICSILRKAEDMGIDYSHAIVTTDNPSEKALALALTGLPNFVVKAAEGYKPNLIADYLFELAQTFNTFYNALPILKENEPIRSSRLLLAAKTAYTIKEGLSLLGIRVLERM